jgi:hypothetical protein
MVVTVVCLRGFTKTVGYNYFANGSGRIWKWATWLGMFLPSVN